MSGLALTCLRRFVLVDELHGQLLCVLVFQLLLPQEIHQLQQRQLLPILREVLEEAQHLLTLREGLVEEHKLLPFQRPRL